MIIDFIKGNGGGGSIQPATPTRLGVVKIGSGVAVTSDGTISVSGGSANLDSAFPRMPYFNLDNGSQVVDYVKSAIFDTHSEGGEPYNCSEIWLLDTAFDWLDNSVGDWEEGQMNFTIDPEEMVAYVDNVPAGNYIFAIYKEQAGDNYEDFPVMYWSKEDGDWTEYMSETTREIWSEPDFEIDPYWQNKMDGHVVLSNNGEWFNWSFPQDVERLEIRIVDDGEGNEYPEINITYKEGGDSPILPLNSLDDEGVEGVLYEMDGHLYKWIDGDGKWGRWIYNVYDSTGEADFGNKENYLLYTDLRPADGEKICALRLISKYYRVELDIEDECLHVYDERNSGGNEVATVVPNSAVTITNSSRSFRITWCPEKNYIEFYDQTAWAEIVDMISTAQTGAHFEALLVDEFRALNLRGPSFGIPAWNSDGTVVGRYYNLDKSVKKINTTGYTNNITLFTDGAHQSYGSWFIPTQPGNAGQVLTSAGNAEPQWATIIKAMQITSAAYDALVQAGTTDPNTLYLIVD